MSDLPLEPADIDRLTRLAAALIPGTATMPGAGEVAAFDALLRTAVKACGYTDQEIRAAIEAIPPDVDWSGAKRLSADDPESFGIAALLVSAAYYMAPAVLDRLNYPTERRHPAGQEDFAEEYMTGVLDGVTERGPRYRDPARHA